MAQDLKKDPKPPLPADHGQFGANNATEDYKPLPEPPPAPPGSP